MFKSEEQVETFVNHLEKFMKAIVMSPPGVDYAANLNKHRDAFESFVKIVCGITEMSNTTDTLLCPDCNGEMALRTNSTNGQKFYGCRKFPKCRGTRDENGLSREEREAQKQKKEEAAQQDGFSFNKGKRDPVNEVAPPPPPVKEWYNPFAK
jgi:hypothetical protein